MVVRVWGCRGSIPSPGADTSRYGGNTTCVEVRLADGTLVIVDAGSGIRALGLDLLKRRSAASRELHLLITHAHWDHLQGFPFFVPAYRSEFTFRVRSGVHSERRLQEFLAHQMEPPYFPVHFSAVQATFDFQLQNGGDLAVGGARVTPVPLSHPNGGYGFVFEEGGRRFVFLTDNELGYSHPGGLSETAYAELCRNAELVFHDAQYTSEEYAFTRGFGHSTYRAATELALAAGVQRFGLFHHDPRRTDRELDRRVRDCRSRLGAGPDGQRCFGVREGMELTV